MEEENNIFSIVVADPTATVAKPPKITKTEKLQEKKTHKLEMKGEWAAKRKEKRIRKMQRQQELLAKLTPTQQKEYYDKIKQQEAFFMISRLIRNTSQIIKAQLKDAFTLI